MSQLEMALRVRVEPCPCRTRLGQARAAFALVHTCTDVRAHSHLFVLVWMSGGAFALDHAIDATQVEATWRPCN